MSTKIKETKSELLVEINNLKHELKEKDEELISAGLKKRETLTSKIEELENDCKKLCLYSIKECEKQTGRTLKIRIHGVDISLSAILED